MNLNEFVSRYNGKYVDTDGYYGGQCMDLMHQYCVEVLGLTDLSILAASSAKVVYENFSNVKGHELFDKIPNTDTGVPQEGDIIFWVNAPYGHVAIFVEGDVNSFRSFDQNYPTGTPCHIQNHTYANVGGWLRLKKTASQSIQVDLEKCRLDRDSHWNDRIAISQKLGVENNMTVIMAELDKLIQEEDSLIQKDKQITEAQKKVTDLTSQLAELNFQHTGLISKAESLTQKVTDQSKVIEDQGKKISSLSSSLDSLKQDLNKPLPTGIKKLIIDFINKL